MPYSWQLRRQSQNEVKVENLNVTLLRDNAIGATIQKHLEEEIQLIKENLESLVSFFHVYSMQSLC